MKNQTFLIQCTRGRGYLAPNASTAFDLPRNWVAKAAKARHFSLFEDASVQTQILPGRAKAEIVMSQYGGYSRL